MDEHEQDGPPPEALAPIKRGPEADEAIEVAGEGALAIRDTIRQIEATRTFVATSLKEKIDYDVIPGTASNKPTLLQPGAEKVCLYLGLRPQMTTKITHLQGGHLRVSVYCDLIHHKTGKVVGSGQASCSTRETKYAFRYLPAEHEPKSKFQAERLKAQGLGRYRNLGSREKPNWVWCDRIENPNLADEEHTVRLIADKRAFVAAVRRTAALSAVFTQDLEDYADHEIWAEMRVPPKMPQQKGNEPPRTNGKPDPASAGQAAGTTTEPGTHEKKEGVASLTGKVESVRIVSNGAQCWVKLVGGMELSTFDKDQFANLEAQKGRRIGIDYSTTVKGDKKYFNIVDWWIESKEPE